MAQPDKKTPDQATEEDISAPRLTPQGRENPDAASVGEGAKKGQSDKAEG
jgi:hypothetical protein